LEARSLILAGAILSIIVNPLLLRAVTGMERWILARPRLAAVLDRQEEYGELEPVDATALSEHVVLIGYGRVGRRIGDALGAAGIPFIVVERDRLVVEAVRKRGVPALFGDAARPGILDHVQLDRARMLVIASPDPYHAQRVIEIAKEKNPAILTAARTHSEAGQQYLEARGVERAFMGERELALSMAHYTLVRMGRTDDEADATVDEMRRITSLGVRAVTPQRG